mgnify:CR=1 FL=1
MIEPQNLLGEWIQLINTGDIESLLKLYDREAILMPTFSKIILSKPEKLREYFESLGARKELNVTIYEDTLVIQEIQKQIFSLSGIYKWQFIHDGVLNNFEARFTYLVNLSKVSPILHHHSSLMPHEL